MRLMTILALGWLGAGTAAAAPQAGLSDQLQGEWRQGCHPSTFQANEFLTQTLVFTGASGFDRRLERYSDAKCSSGALLEVQELAGAYALTGPAKGLKDAQQIDFTVRTLASTAFTPLAARLLNSRGYCSIRDWKEGERRSVLDLPCEAGKLTAGSVIFDVAKVQDGKLYLGMKSYLSDGSSPRERPVAFGARPFERAQKTSH